MIFCWKFSVAESALLVFLVQISYKMGGGRGKTQTPQFLLQVWDYLKLNIMRLLQNIQKIFIRN